MDTNSILVQDFSASGVERGHYVFVYWVVTALFFLVLAAAAFGTYHGRRHALGKISTASVILTSMIIVSDHVRKAEPDMFWATTQFQSDCQSLGLGWGLFFFLGFVIWFVVQGCRAFVARRARSNVK
jgi:hypothetical protein